MFDDLIGVHGAIGGDASELLASSRVWISISEVFSRRESTVCWSTPTFRVHRRGQDILKKINDQKPLFGLVAGQDNPLLVGKRDGF